MNEFEDRLSKAEKLLEEMGNLLKINSKVTDAQRCRVMPSHLVEEWTTAMEELKGDKNVV